MKKHTRIWAAIGALLIVLGLLVPAGGSATTAADWGPGFKACGSFSHKTIHVFAKDLTCRRARAIQKELWLGPRSRKIVRFPKLGPEEIRLKRFPGFVCISGTGGGNCVKGEMDAAYSNLP